MRSRIFTTLFALSLLATGSAAQESPLRACRAIAATAERLACYDAIPLPAPPPPQVIETSIAGPFRGWEPKQKITMTNGQVWQIVDGSVGVVNLTDPKVTIRRDFIAGYHLEFEGANVYPRVKQVFTETELAAAAKAEQTANADPDAVIESSIVGPFNGWWPKDRIKLANGQVWQIADDSTGAVKLTDPKVRISRRMFGGYTLEIEGSAKAPSVKRVQ